MADLKREEQFVIRMTKEEKELWFKVSKEIGINPSRMARNIIMDFAESKINRNITKAFVHLYKKYNELAENQEVLNRLNSH